MIRSIICTCDCLALPSLIVKTRHVTQDLECFMQTHPEKIIPTLFASSRHFPNILRGNLENDRLRSSDRPDSYLTVSHFPVPRFNVAGHSKTAPSLQLFIYLLYLHYNRPMGYASAMLDLFGTIVGTSAKLLASTFCSANNGIRRTRVFCSIWNASCSSFFSDQGLPRISAPIGTPFGAESVAGENPAGIVTTGDPVNAARIPFLPDCEAAPIFTTRFFCSG